MNRENLREINSLNQRGGRMLSIIDLIERETIPIDLASYLFHCVRIGSSFLFVAKPGGAGKTALQGAILGLLDDFEQIITIENGKFLTDLKNEINGNEYSQQTTFIVHEIGSGSWYGYLWGKPVVDFLNLNSSNLRIVSNMHQDTLPEIYRTLKGFGASESQIQNFDLIIKIEYDSIKRTRKIQRAWHSESDQHMKIFDMESGLDLKIAHFDQDKQYQQIFREMLDKNIRKIAEVHDYLYECLENKN